MSHSHVSTSSNRKLGDVAAKVIGPAIVIGFGGVAATLAIAAFMDGGWDRFFRSYLMAFMFVLSICLGALFFVVLQHAVKAGWSVVVRRLAEGVAGNLVWIWILFLPILIPVVMGKSNLYEWMHVVEDGKLDPVLQYKSPYFFFTHAATIDAQGHAVQTAHVPWFWILRAVLYFTLWAVIAKFYVSTSVKQDSTGDENLTTRMEHFAPVSMLAFGLTLAFSAMDWVMSVQPHWFSTMFPVYFFAATTCGFFSVQILVMFFMQRNGRLTAEITPEHFQDAGKLLFAFGIVFWAYIAFSQYMLIWYANIPEETPWYLTRQIGGWGWISLLLLFGHFLGPFLALLSRHPKRRTSMLAAAATWMLFMHFVDIYWLVMPKVPSALPEFTSYKALASAVAENLTHKGTAAFDPALDVGFGFSILDVTATAGLLGLIVLGSAWRLTGVSLIPERDPRLHESLAFENM